ncbi:MAG: FecCD family ABC transporter permease [Acidobacteriota bacterium]
MKTGKNLWLYCLMGLAAVALAGAASAAAGSVHIPFSSVLGIAVSRLPFFDAPGTPEDWNTILWEIRFPRIVLAGLVGAALAVAGATYQGLFRNSLADPYLLGVASGAGLGATIVLTTGAPIYLYGFSLVPLASFAGSLLAVSAAYITAGRRAGPPSRTSLILAGVVVGSLASALTSLLLMRSEPDLRPVLAWLLGGFTGAHWDYVTLTLPYLIPGMLALLAYGRTLNVLQLNEDEAQQLGIDVRKTRLILVGLASLVTAVAVSVSGLIGFVGLIAPHAVRLLWGQDYRLVLPLSMLAGAAFLIVADLAARTMLGAIELPVGMVTAFCGAPFFLYLLRRVGRDAQ